MSLMGLERTHASQQTTSLLDHPVGAREQRWWNFNAEFLGRFKVDHQVESGWLLKRAIRPD
jgi:hypothetical protein